MSQQRLKLTDYFSTTDLALAAAISLFFPLEAINATSSYKSEFLFKRIDDLDRLVEAYWKGELKVEPRAYFNQLKAIKSRLYSERRDL